MEKLLNKKELASILGCSDKTLRENMDHLERKLQWIQVGRFRKCRKSSVMKWIDKCYKNGEPLF